MRRAAQGGFTLLEVVIVLAISSLLLLLLSNQHSTAATQAFVGGIDTIRNDIAQVKNEANATVNDNPCVPSGNAACNAVFNNSGQYDVVWGKEVEIIGSSGTTMNTYTIKVAVNRDGSLQPGSVRANLDRTVTLPDGIVTRSGDPTKYVVFLRDINTGTLQAYFPSSPSNQPSSMTTGGGTQVFNFAGPEGGHTGTVSVDQASLAITRLAL